MGIERSIRVEALDGGGVAVVARDWPWALWFAVPVAAAALPLLAWGLADGHWIEAGGALVFAGIAGTTGWLALAKRRRVELRGRELIAREGAGPFAREVRHELAAAPSFVVEPFPVPVGAPAIDDRGADLVLLAADLRYPLARCVGPGWRELEEVQARLTSAIRA